MMSHLLPLVDGTTGQPMEEPQAPTWVDNWQRLGLVNVTYTEFSTNAGAYDWVQERPEYVRLAEQITQLNFDKGLMQTTDFGRQFLRAVTQ
jgi:Abortive infection alpha